MTNEPTDNTVPSRLTLPHGVICSSEFGRRSIGRRRFLTASAAAVASLGLAPAAGRAQSNGGTSIASNFNGTPIPAGDWIWFTAALKTHGLGSSSVTVGFMSSIQFSVNGVPYFVPVPAALLTFSPGNNQAVTAFTNGQWVTNVPLSGLSGNVYLTGVALQSPLPAGFPGGLNPVTWQGTFFSMTPGLTVDWQWAAAVYESPAFGIDYTQLGVKPVDDNKASIYQNSDHAGTPENFKGSVTGGARGGGGSNFTGSLSATAAVIPVPGNMGGSGS